MVPPRRRSPTPNNPTLGNYVGSWVRRRRALRQLRYVWRRPLRAQSIWRRRPIRSLRAIRCHYAGSTSSTPSMRRPTTTSSLVHFHPTWRTMPCQRNAAGRSVRSCFGCMTTLMDRHNGILAKRRPSENVRLTGSQQSAGYSSGGNARSATPRALTWSCVNFSIKKNKLIRGQVSCQAVATKMAVNFDLVRAGHKDEAEIDSYAPVMTVSHRCGPVYTQVFSQTWSSDEETGGGGGAKQPWCCAKLTDRHHQRCNIIIRSLYYYFMLFWIFFYYYYGIFFFRELIFSKDIYS